MEERLEQVVNALADKASSTSDSGDAMRFSQAALNVANARGVLNQE